MNALLMVLQVLLALHTAMGAVWKFGHAEDSVPSLKALPHGAWLALAVFEIVCAIALIVPVFTKADRIAGLAAVGIVLEMLLFCAVFFSSGDRSYAQVIYWVVVALVAAFIAWARLASRPIPS